MKKFILLFVSSTFLFSYQSFAAVNSATINVSGLVCDFCARAVEKVFSKQEAVSNIKVDLDKKTIVIDFKDNQSVDDKTITQLVTDAGYNVVSIIREDKPQ